MSCITVTEVDCDTAVLVSTPEAPEIVRVVDSSVVVTEQEPSTVIQTTDTTVVVTEELPAPIISECKQGPPGQDGLDGSGVVEVPSGPVANGNTVTADQVLWSAFRSVKWIVTIIDDASSEYKTYEVLAVHNDVTVLFSVYGIVGASISVSNDVVLAGSFMELQITNNSANDIDIKVQRIATTV